MQTHKTKITKRTSAGLILVLSLVVVGGAAAPLVAASGSSDEPGSADSSCNGGLTGINQACAYIDIRSYWCEDAWGGPMCYLTAEASGRAFSSVGLATGTSQFDTSQTSAQSGPSCNSNLGQYCYIGPVSYTVSYWASWCQYFTWTVTFTVTAIGPVPDPASATDSDSVGVQAPC